VNSLLRIEKVTCEKHNDGRQPYGTRAHRRVLKVGRLFDVLERMLKSWKRARESKSVRREGRRRKKMERSGDAGLSDRSCSGGESGGKSESVAFGLAWEGASTTFSSSSRSSGASTGIANSKKLF